MCCGPPGTPDGLEGVCSRLVAIRGLAFGPQLAQPTLVEGVVEQLAGLVPQFSDHRRAAGRNRG
jgi:hypothetical protein